MRQRDEIAVPRRWLTAETPLEVRRRTEGDVGSPIVVVGHAAVFNQRTTIYRDSEVELREVVRRGAFKNALFEKQDVRALVEHDPARLIGRSKANTLRMKEDDVGLAVEIDLPGTSVGRDSEESLRRGDLAEMSFAFLPRDGGEKTTITRAENGATVIESEITDVDLYDVSLVAYPAYAGTDAAVRARSMLQRSVRESRRALLASVREKLDRLGVRVGASR